MGKIIRDSDSNIVNLVKHLPNMPKNVILLDDTTKLCWKWSGDIFPTQSDYPGSHHIK